MISRRAFTLLTAATALVPALARAQAYPTHPINFVVPFPAGNVTDVLARRIAHGLSTRLGQTITVDNRAGAAGIIGTRFVAAAKPDGYTMLYGSSGPIASHPSMYKDLPYAPLESFAPVNGLTSSPLVLVTAASQPYTSVHELVEHLKNHPGEVTFGSPGNGTGAHLAAELFQVNTGTRMTHVPYKDSAGLYSDLFAGRIDVLFDFIAVMRPNLDAGKVRALAVTREQRASSLPSVPTLKESGYDVVFNTWSSLLMPAGTPADIVQKMSDAVRDTMASAEIVKYLEENDSISNAELGPQELRAFIVSEIEMYQHLVKKAGISAN
ncbi:tripartite tricarboxylate transporter substrate binding protein [Verticiella sediminum]|uniref:Tripartite tricarboxylate transporter substrate binding protein n=1 Tax=Verticiella sediminum TaxID=1247510 RepID=A0A556AJA2_9BURK|nr:tripartite tricarboxylate transporter substrate binding protein [Verticiella sediminum]TSH92956.1 tripartite tricarboxylate transporter substrate binding protein [Verticiella sediminum]